MHPSNERELAGQVALVTGGGRGIGRAIAIEFARAGAAVAVVSRTEAELDVTVEAVHALGGVAIAVTADAPDPAAVAAATTAVAGRLGPISVLVNCAARNTAFGPTWELDGDEWWRDMTVNVRGPFLFCQSVLPAMIARRAGRIINLVSGLAQVPGPYLTAYAVSKAAVSRLTDSLAAELTEHGVAVFALSPGSVATDMSRGVIESEAVRRWLPALGASLRYVEADVPAKTAVLLAAGHADALSGRLLHVSDDIPELVRRAAQVAEQDLYQLRLRKLPG